MLVCSSVIHVQIESVIDTKKEGKLRRKQKEKLRIKKKTLSTKSVFVLFQIVVKNRLSDAFKIRKKMKMKYRTYGHEVHADVRTSKIRLISN